MRNQGLAGLAITATFACCLYALPQANGIINHYREALTSMQFASWMTGFILTIIASPICCLLFWLIAGRLRHGFIVHLLLIPVIYAFLQAAAAVMLSAAQKPDLDSLTGYALLPALLLATLCPAVYFLALAVCHVRRRWWRAIDD